MTKIDQTMMAAVMIALFLLSFFLFTRLRAAAVGEIAAREAEKNERCRLALSVQLTRRDSVLYAVDHKCKLAP